MRIQKKDRFKATYNGKMYEVAGRWDSSIILSPVDEGDDQCLIYSPAEMEELMESGKFQNVTRNDRLETEKPA